MAWGPVSQLGLPGRVQAPGPGARSLGYGSLARCEAQDAACMETSKRFPEVGAQFCWKPPPHNGFSASQRFRPQSELQSRPAAPKARPASAPSRHPGSSKRLLPGWSVLAEDWKSRGVDSYVMFYCIMVYYIIVYILY